MTAYIRHCSCNYFTKSDKRHKKQWLRWSEWCDQTVPTDEACTPPPAAAAELAATRSHITDACCSSSWRMYANASSSWHLRNSASRVTFETASRRSCSSVSTLTPPFCDDDAAGFTCWTDSLAHRHTCVHSQTHTVGHIHALRRHTDTAVAQSLTHSSGMQLHAPCPGKK